MLMLKGSPGIQNIINYEKFLSEKYHGELLSLYGSAIAEFAEKSMGRDSYRLLTGYIKRMAAISGGREQARAMVANFRELYKNRKAMLDEMKNLNF